VTLGLAVLMLRCGLEVAVLEVVVCVLSSPVLGSTVWHYRPALLALVVRGFPWQ